MDSNEDKRSTQTAQECPQDKKIRIENPFIAFRRFADETIGSALQSIIGLPSAVSKQLEGALPGLDKIRDENARHEESESFRDRFRKLHRKEAEDPQNLLEELRRHREQHRKRWEYIREAIHQGPDADLEVTETNMNNDRSDRMNPAARAMESGQDQNRDHDRQTPPPSSRGGIVDFVESFYRDTGILDGNMLSPLGSMIVSRLNSQLSQDSPSNYLFFSPYSPLLLSNRIPDVSEKSRYAPDSFPYCDAFEDLMLASRGMDMVPLERRRERQASLSVHAARPHDIIETASWISRLKQQGLIDSWPRRDEQSEEDDGTELGMYQRFLSGAFPKSSVDQREERRETSTVSTVQEEKFSQESSPPNSGGVLSTLTRTETQRFPDGRVETKVVLVKRFADGGETRTETVHTNHEGNPSSQGSLEDGKQTKEEKKGWFWN